MSKYQTNGDKILQAVIADEQLSIPMAIIPMITIQFQKL